MYDISYAAAGGSFEREQEDSLNKKIPHRWEERQGIRSYVRLLFIDWLSEPTHRTFLHSPKSQKSSLLEHEGF